MYTVTQRERTVTLVGIMVALLLGALDQTIVATAMPRILQDLKGLNLYTWVVTAYLLASTSMIPIYGKLSDIYGRKRVVLIGVVLFLLGSVLSGQARSMTELIIFRAVQGLGNAGIFSTAFTVVADLFSPAERGRYQGIFGAVFGLASVIGPWLGGFLTDTVSWRWVFYVNLPIGAVALLLILLQMPPLKPTLERKVRINVWSSVTLLVAVIPLLLALSLGGQEYPWGSWQVLGAFGLSAAGILLFVLAERGAAEPLIPFDLFRNRTYVVGNAAALLIAGVAFFGAIMFLPIYMVMVVGVTASAAGLTIMPLTLGLVVSSLVAGQVVSRTGRYKVFLLAGTAIVFIGYILMLGLTPETTRWQVTWRMIILGVGIGPALPLYNLAVQNAVHPREVGVATSSSLFFRQIGSTVGIAVFGTILATVLSAQLAVYMPPELAGKGSGMSFSAGQLETGNLSSVGDEIRKGMDDTYAKIEAVFLRDDAAAKAELLASPQVPQAMKDMLQSGGIAAQVKAGLDAQYQAIAAAVGTGKPAALAALAADSRLDERTRAQLAAIPAAAIATPQGRAAILAGIRRGFDAALPAVTAQASQAALAQIKASLDAEATKLTGDVTTALKKALTDAILRIYFWGIFVVAAGFVVTLFLPQLALRKTTGHAAMAAEGMPPLEGGSPAAGAAQASPAAPER